MCYCPVIVEKKKKPVYKCVTVPLLLEKKKPVYKCVTVLPLLGGKKPVYKCVTVPSWLMATSAAVQRPHAPSARAAAPISRSCGAVGDGDGALCSPSAAVAFDRPRSKRQVHGLLHAPIVGQNNVFTLAECLD